MIKKYIKKVINSGPVRYGTMIAESMIMPMYTDRRTSAEKTRDLQFGARVKNYLSKPIEPVLNEKKSGWGYEVNPKNPLVKKVKRYISK